MLKTIADVGTDVLVEAHRKANRSREDVCHLVDRKIDMTATRDAGKRELLARTPHDEKAHSYAVQRTWLSKTDLKSAA